MEKRYGWIDAPTLTSQWLRINISPIIKMLQRAKRASYENNLAKS